MELRASGQVGADGPTEAHRGASATAFDDRSVPRLLDQLLAEQQSLTAVERFARREAVAPTMPGRYEDLIPVGRPAQGQQLAFRVDLDACTGCKACVTACHNLNGLDADETWRAVGRVVGSGDASGIERVVTTACHHCEDPACANGCPVRAYEKDPVTGIVRHLDDQCIGCQYCLLTCPYEVPQYNERLGIVRKCDLCADRLGVGEAPACVQGCPNQAIAVEIVDRGAPVGDRLLPIAGGLAPDPAYTRPTTRYVSRLETPWRPAAAWKPVPSAAHDPLAVMLVLLQLSLGALCGVAALRLGGHAGVVTYAVLVVLAAVAAGLGMLASLRHLGRPLYAFRAFLGWRTSWMSREILVVGAYAGALVAAAALHVLAPWAAAALPVELGRLRLGAVWLEGSAVGLGLLGLLCSVMIYVDTRRPLWALGRTAPRFLASVVVQGLAAVLAVGALVAGSGVEEPRIALAGLGVLAGLAALAKLIGELTLLRHRARPAGTSLWRTARLLTGPLRARLGARSGAAIAGALCAVASAVASAAARPMAAAAFASASLVLLFVGELVERHLFFTSEASVAMPVDPSVATAGAGHG